MDGDELIVTVPHPVRLVDAIGIEWTDPHDDTLVTDPAEAVPVEATPALASRWASVPVGWKVGAAAVATLAILWVFFPVVLVGILVLAGVALLIGGGAAALDPFTSVQLPERLTPGRLLGAGTGVVLIALGLAVWIT